MILMRLADDLRNSPDAAGGVSSYSRAIEALPLTDVPVMIPVVAMRNLRPLVCFDIHRNADISV